MPQRSYVSSRAGERGQVSIRPQKAPAPQALPTTAILENKAFVDLSRVLGTGEPAIISNALPILVRGASAPSGVVFGASEGNLTFVAAHNVPLKLRAYLEEPGYNSAPDFIAQRALTAKRTINDANVFGDSATPGALIALDEASWQSSIAVPIITGKVASFILLVGTRTGTSESSTIGFLEAVANLIGAALTKPSVQKSSRPPPPMLTQAGILVPLAESLAALGREVATQQSVVRQMCFRPGAPPEADILLGNARAIERMFRRLSEIAIHVPPADSNGSRLPTSMSAIIDAAVAASRPALAKAGAELSVLCAPPSDFEGDPDLMTLAVKHLVVNAAEAVAETVANEGSENPSGLRTVRICARIEGQNAALHIEDSGPGVPHGLRARVFEPAVSTKGPGRGLGLSIARQVVEAHGGWMELGGSELGGARVSIYVPSRCPLLDALRKAPTVPQMPAQIAPRPYLPDPRSA